MSNKYDFYDLEKVEELAGRPETIEIDGYYWDPTDLPPKDYLDTQVPASFKNIGKWMRSKMNGLQTRETMARLAEMVGINTYKAVDVAERTQIRQDAVEQYNNQMIAEMTDKEFASGPEIVQTRDGEPLLIDRIKRDVKKHQNVQNMIADITLSEGQAVQTMGFHTESDDGGARYVVTSEGIPDGMTLIALDNGLKAKIIYGSKINVHQLGAKGDNSSDDYYPIQKAFDMFEVVEFGKRLMYRVTQQPSINIGITVIGNYSSIVGFNCIPLKITTKWSNRATLERLYLRRGDRKDFLGLELDAGSWGTCAIFREVYVVGAKIGLKALDVHHFDASGLRFAGCDVDMWITQSEGVFSNIMRIRNPRFSEGGIGLVLENVQGAEFTMASFEHLDIGVVVSNSTTTTKFYSPWFERIKIQPVYCGTINPDTLELTPTGELVSTIVDKGVEFINARFSDDGVGYAKSFYPESRKFLSQYGNYNSIYGYEDNTEALMMSGIQYTNLGRTDVNLNIVSPNGTVTKTTKNTPFGSKTVVTGTGIYGAKTRLTSSTPATPFATGDYVLLKAKIWSSKKDRVYLYLADESETRISTENGFAMETVKDGWIEIASIVKITAAVTSSFLYFTASLDRQDKGVAFNIEATDISIINLTSIFGSGYEPDVSFARKIAPYFTHATYNTAVKTGYGR